MAKIFTLKLTTEQLWFLREIFEASFTDPDSMNEVERSLSEALTALSAKAQGNRKAGR